MVIIAIEKLSKNELKRRQKMLKKEAEKAAKEAAKAAKQAANPKPAEEKKEDEEDEALRFVPGFISSPREVLLQLLDHAFPEILLPEAQPAVTTEEGDPSLFNPRRVGTGL